MIILITMNINLDTISNTRPLPYKYITLPKPCQIFAAEAKNWKIVIWGGCRIDIYKTFWNLVFVSFFRWVVIWGLQNRPCRNC